MKRVLEPALVGDLRHRQPRRREQIGAALHAQLPQVTPRRLLVRGAEKTKQMLGRNPRRARCLAQAIMIAGEDPHAWKGIADKHQVWVRPSGEGGCLDSNAKPATKM